MADLGEQGGDGNGGMDLNLNLSPPSTPHPHPHPHLGLALGLGVGPTSPVSAASVNEEEMFLREGEGSIPRRVWLSDPHRVDAMRAAFRNGEEAAEGVEQHRARHRLRQLRRVRPSVFRPATLIPPSAESLSPFIVLRAVDQINPSDTDTELERRNPLKENPSTLRGCPVTAKQDADERNGNSESNASNFECNICLEMAREPVVTSCGHLFCWACLYQWLHVHSTSKECPVCKGEVTDTNITPIYGRGNSDEAADESRTIENGEKIPPRPRANRIESLRQRFGRPVSRRFMEAIRLTRRREAHNDIREHLHARGGARQDEASTQGVENLLGAAADQILNSFSLVHFHRQTANLQRTRSGEDRWQMRQVLARRSLLRPHNTTSNALSLLDMDDRLRLHREGERERERESIWGHLQFGRLHRSSSERLASLRERVTPPMEGIVESLSNNSANSDVNEQGLQGVVRSGVSDNNRERASISSTNAMILNGSRNGDTVVEQDSGISSSPQRRRHAPSCSLDSDGSLLNARKRRRLN